MMIDLHNRENSLWNVLLLWKMMLKSSQNFILFTLFIKIKISVNEIRKNTNQRCSTRQTTNKKIAIMFSPSQHGTACCALMHSATYIIFSQRGSHISLMSTSWFGENNLIFVYCALVLPEEVCIQQCCQRRPMERNNRCKYQTVNQLLKAPGQHW